MLRKEGAQVDIVVQDLAVKIRFSNLTAFIQQHSLYKFSGKSIASMHVAVSLYNAEETRGSIPE